MSHRGNYLSVGVQGIVALGMIIIGWWIPNLFVLLLRLWSGLEERYGYWFHVYGSARVVLIAVAIWAIFLYRHIGADRSENNLFAGGKILAFWITMSLIVLVESFVCDPGMWSGGNSIELFLFKTEYEAWVYTQFLVSVNSLLGFWGIFIQYSNGRLHLDFQGYSILIWIVSLIWFVATIWAYHSITHFVWLKTGAQGDLSLRKKIFVRGRVVILMVLWLTNSIWLHYRGYQLEDLAVMGFMTLMLTLLSVPFTYLLLRLMPLFMSNKY